MRPYRFKIGDLVLIQVDASANPGESFFDAISHKKPKGVHEVTRLMPRLVNDEPQYRIKGPDGQERVVRDSQLVAAAHHPQPRR
jgi:hypothetical protein